MKLNISPQNLRKWLRSSTLVSNLYYGLHIDDLPVVLGLKTYNNAIVEAIEKYLPNVTDKERVIIKKDIKRCYLKYKISPTEYFLFNFKSLLPNQRSEYLSDKTIYMTMGKIVGRKLHDKQLEDKYNFYQIAQKYFYRKALLIASANDYKVFEDFVTETHDVIIKPNSSACGNGIRVEHIHNRNEAMMVFSDIIKKGNSWIVEELIQQSDEMASWNQTSVNTIRISSFLNEKGFFILCPFIRTGRRGAVVDNGGQGGLYAAIDAKTGVIITNGKDELCNVYKEHPDSHIIYKGWQVPQWDKLVLLTEKVHSLFPKHRYVGWDFAHTKEGWVLIEGNWGEFIAQQSTMGKGYKKEFLDLLLEK